MSEMSQVTIRAKHLEELIGLVEDTLIDIEVIESGQLGMRSHYPDGMHFRLEKCLKWLESVKEDVTKLQGGVR
jgi:hypothetical protein